MAGKFSYQSSVISYQSSVFSPLSLLRRSLLRRSPTPRMVNEFS
ncbi:MULTISPECIES: hypothetical protein [Microcystis]|nr:MULTISPECIES: hypothetical protein [Microcystis]